GAGIGVSAAVEVVGSLCQIGVTIYEQFQLAKANKSQCKRLADRVVVVCSSVMGLDLTSKKGNYIFALQKLETTLKKAQQLIEKFAHDNWFKQVLCAGTDSEEFKKIYSLLKEHIQQLNLALTAQQVLNNEEDQKDARLDRDEIKNNIKTIIDSNVDLKQQLQTMQLEQKDRSKILDQQMASMTLA
ncbi:MAG: hypothetical protein ACK4PR_12005, partial [Gammaproteobacteria bacterium]